MNVYSLIPIIYLFLIFTFSLESMKQVRFIKAPMASIFSKLYLECLILFINASFSLIVCYDFFQESYIYSSNLI